MMKITTRDSLSTRDMRGFEIAVKAAQLSTCRFAHGSALLYNSKVLSLACNIVKTHPVLQRYGKHTCSIHAEVRSLLLARVSVIGATCYSARINLRGDYLISKPCLTCELYLREAGIATIVYYDGKAHQKELYI